MQLTEAHKSAIADITIQAMMFDMDIDWENFVLIQKRKVYQEPFWLTKWRESLSESDRQPSDYEGGKDER